MCAPKKVSHHAVTTATQPVALPAAEQTPQAAETTPVEVATDSYRTEAWENAFNVFPKLRPASDLDYYKAQLGIGRLPTLSEPSQEDILRAAQTEIVGRFGELHIGLTQMKPTYFDAEGGFVPSHLFATITGNGLTMARVHGADDAHTAAKNVNEPDLLFYAPKNPTAKANYADTLPDGDYVLIGWGYYQDYTPGQKPEMAGMTAGDWFVHERGVHTLDGGFLLQQPDEAYLGEAAAEALPIKGADVYALGTAGVMSRMVGSVLGLNDAATTAVGSHGRVWDSHVFRTDLITGTDSAPVVQMLAPDGLLPEGTLTLPEASFFYPEESTKKSSQKVAAK